MALSLPHSISHQPSSPLHFLPFLPLPWTRRVDSSLLWLVPSLGFAESTLLTAQRVKLLTWRSDVTSLLEVAVGSPLP